MKESHLITSDRHGDVAIVSLDRPDRLNALSVTLVEELDRYLQDLVTDTKAVVLTGAGRAFCAGIDLKDGVGERTGSALSDMLGRYDLQQRFARLVTTMRAIRQPIIAAVHGPAVGGGLSLAAACDIRVADPTAQFSVAFVNVGLTGGDMGTSYFLPKTIPTSAAAELLYTGRTFDGQEAHRLGFVSHLTADGADLDAAIEIAVRISSHSPIGIRLTKEAFNSTLSGVDLQTALALENRAQVMCMFTEPFEEAITAFRTRGENR